MSWVSAKAALDLLDGGRRPIPASGRPRHQRGDVGIDTQVVEVGLNAMRRPFTPRVRAAE